MIYLDSSVLLSFFLSEDRCPEPGFWFRAPLTASRLAEYEVWNRLHARNRAGELAPTVKKMFGGIYFVELTAEALARALQPFPHPVKTLDGLHLATAVYLQRSGNEVEFATYDRGLASAAQAVGIELAQL